VQLFLMYIVEIIEIGVKEKSMKNQRKVLRRSQDNRMLAGVCGGLSEFFGISAFWFRLAFLIALLPGGIPGIAIYLILWIIIPNA